MAKKIGLDIDSSLYINSDNQLTVKIASGSTLQIKDDGLYAEATQGTDGTGGTGYDNQTNLDYVQIGYPHPFSYSQDSDYLVSCVSVVHRLFDATINGSNVTLKNFRKVDCVLVGDMFRVSTSDGKYTYYLVTGTSDESTSNRVTTYVTLGEW